MIEDKKSLKILYISILIFLLPFFLGLLFMFLSSVGISFAWEGRELSLDAYKSVVSPIVLKQFVYAFIRTNIIGVIAFIALFSIGYFLSMGKRSKALNMCIYLLSQPHISLAVGVMFLLMPTGLIFRILANIRGSEEVSSHILVNDPFGITMSFVVLLKIVPFLVFIMLGSFNDYHLQYQVLQSKLLGHGAFRTWTFIMFPQLMPKIIMPFLIALVYALTPVDISVILGPLSPSSIGLMIQQLAIQSLKDKYLEAQAISVFLLIMALSLLALWYGVFVLIRKLLKKGYSNSQNLKIDDAFMYRVVKIVVGLGIFIVILAVLCLIIWSAIVRWDYPSLIPSKLGFSKFLIYKSQVYEGIRNSLLVAMTSDIFSLVLSIYILETLTKNSWKGERIILGLLLLPILIPRVVYVSGMHIFYLLLHMNSSFLALVWAHSIKVTPYICLMLYGVMKHYHHGYIQQARVLGKSYLNSLLRIKLPMISTSIWYVFVIGALVSISEYEITQFIGGGIWPTITTLTAVLSTSGDTQIMSISGILLSIINFVVLILGNTSRLVQRGNREVSL